MLKVVGSELEYRRSALALSVGGLPTLEAESSAASEWLQAPANCIAGGTTEIQLNVIAKRSLGLPEHV